MNLMNEKEKLWLEEIKKERIKEQKQSKEENDLLKKYVSEVGDLSWGWLKRLPFQ